MATSLQYKKNATASLLISTFAILTNILFLFITIFESLFFYYIFYKLYENILISKMLGDVKNLNDTSAIDKFSKIYDEVSNSIIWIVLTALIVIISLFIARGWNDIKKSIIKIDNISLIKKISNSFEPNLLNTITWYKGKRFSSYGFIKKKIIIGVESVVCKSEKSIQFMIFHELAHLKYRDSIVKNFFINLIVLFFPIFSVLIFCISLLSVFFSKLNSSSTEFESSQFFTYGLFSIFYLILFRLSSISLLEWFSKSKEYLADYYAMLSTNSFIPDFENNEDKYHPSKDDRVSNLIKPKTISGFPPILFSIVVLNSNFLDYFNSGFKIFLPLAILLIFITAIFLDFLFLKIFMLKKVDMFKLISIGFSFVLWYMYSFNYHKENGTLHGGLFFDSMIFFNVIFIIILMFYCAIMKFLQVLKKT